MGSMEISTISYFSFGHCHLKYCVDSVASSRICWSVYICFEYVEASEVPYFVFYVHSVMSCGPYRWNKRNLKLNTNGNLKECCLILNEVNLKVCFYADFAVTWSIVVITWLVWCSMSIIINVKCLITVNHYSKSSQQLRSRENG